MALNIAVPLSGVGGLSPISPIGIDCWENIKILVSPIGSESSGVSSLDSEEAKQQMSQHQHHSTPAAKSPEDLKIFYNGRDILDLATNTNTNNQKLWNLRYTYLPENNNIPMFLANRSQYHRLGANGHIQEYSLVKCEDCDFQYPINSSSSYFCQTSVTYSPTTNSAMTFTGCSTINHHQNSYHNQNKNINNNSYNHVKNVSDNLFCNNFLKKTTNSNSATTTPTMSITPPSLTAATSPTSSSGYSSSSSIGKYQTYNNNTNNNIKTPFSMSANYNNFYSSLNSLNSSNVNSSSNNNNNNCMQIGNNNAAVNFNNSNFNSANYSNNNNNNSGYLNGQQQNYTRMYKYF